MVDAKKAEGISAEGVEVTPEMIEAGLQANALYDDRFDSKEQRMEEVFRAMYLEMVREK